MAKYENISKDTKQPDETETRSCLDCIPARFVLAFLAFSGFVNVYALRVNLSVALVAMVNTTTYDLGKNITGECLDLTNGTVEVKNGEFNWDHETQGIILGAFFYGYIFTQVPGGWLAQKIGGKRLFGMGVLCTAVLTLVTPLAAKWNLYALLAVRIMEGLGEGVTFPAMHAMWGKWAPLWERSRLCAFTYAGAQLGTVISLPISGLLAKYGFAGGWPSVFYVFGTIACLWFVLWMLIIYDTPAQHPKITCAERDYIETSIGMQKELNTPWASLATSPAVWAIITSHFCFNWGFYTLLTSLPTYMKEILKFDIKQNGLLSALPYLLMWIVMNSGGFLADFLRERQYLSTKNTRKLMNSIGMVVPALFLVSIKFIGCDHVAAVAMITLSVGTSGFCMSGFNTNHLDIAPYYAGMLMGITNTFGTIPGMLCPYIVGYLTNEKQNSEQWEIVFYITLGVNLLGAILFIILASGHQQEWASGKNQTIDIDQRQAGENKGKINDCFN